MRINIEISNQTMFWSKGIVKMCVYCNHTTNHTVKQFWICNFITKLQCKIVGLGNDNGLKLTVL